ncbi:MAG: hypothetical protein LUI85_10215 [Bacteroides sp.]|nr:hypothetical protein [Bacteroides sp.]
MKKILFLLSMFALFSCEQENLDNLVDDSNTKAEQQSIVNSRAVTDIDPIAELNGIQVNIINMGTGSKKYLSCAKKGDKVDLYDKDDGSMRQRWYVGNGTIKLVGGNQTFDGQDAYVGPHNTTDDEPYPCVHNGKMIIGQPSIIYCGNFRYINDDLVIENFPLLFPPSGFGVELAYLQPETKNSSTLQYKKGNNDMSTHWRLELVGDDYEFEKIQYIKAAGDYIGLEAPQYREYEYSNEGKPDPGKAVFQINASVKYKSEFTESQAVSISNKVNTGISIGTPSSVSGNISNETTTSYGWTFTTTKGQETDVSITDTYEYIVPADKYIKMKVYIASYTMSITYIMTVRRKHDGKLFRVKGKWSGVQGTKITYEAVDGYTGAPLSQKEKDVAGK